MKLLFLFCATFDHKWEVAYNFNLLRCKRCGRNETYQSVLRKRLSIPRLYVGMDKDCALKCREKDLEQCKVCSKLLGGLAKEIGKATIFDGDADRVVRMVGEEQALGLIMRNPNTKLLVTREDNEGGGYDYEVRIAEPESKIRMIRIED